MARNVADYQAQYTGLPYESVQVAFRKRKIVETLARYQHGSLLEVGCGRESIFLDIDTFEKMVVVEPSELFYQKALSDSGKKPGKEIILIQGYLEDVAERLREWPFDFVLLSSLLHEVTDPAKLLSALRGLCSDKTVLHINVPNAKSFHCLLAVEMGLIESEFQKSVTNIRLQQSTVLDLEMLQQIVQQCGFEVLESGAYAFKPFTHEQMQRALDAGLLTPQMLDGFCKMERYVPDVCSEIFVNVRIDQGSDHGFRAP